MYYRTPTQFKSLFCSYIAPVEGSNVFGKFTVFDIAFQTCLFFEFHHGFCVGMRTDEKSHSFKFKKTS